MEQMASGTVRSKLLFLLHRLSEKFGEPLYDDTPTEWIQLGVKVTHKELANMIGSIRETVTEGLNHFISEGIINKTNTRGYFLVHCERLKEALEDSI